jgi:hypothetical protein
LSPSADPLAPDETIDAYASILANLALARESMYRHARKVAEFGHGGSAVRAQDPAAEVVVGVAILVVGLFADIAGSSGLDPLGLGSPGLDFWFGVTMIIAGALILIVAVIVFGLFY